jgi:hypothetical protein
MVALCLAWHRDPFRILVCTRPIIQTQVSQLKARLEEAQAEAEAKDAATRLDFEKVHYSAGWEELQLRGKGGGIDTGIL